MYESAITLLLAFLLVGHTKADALSYFLSKHPVQMERITELNGTWIEYTYHFRQQPDPAKDSIQTSALRVGITCGSDLEFDCVGEGYSTSIVRELLALNRLDQDFNAEAGARRSVTYVRYNLSGDAVADLIADRVDMVICQQDVETGSSSAAHLIGFFETLSSPYTVIYRAGNLRHTHDIFVLSVVGSLWLCFLAVLVALACALRISTRYYARLAQESTLASSDPPLPPKKQKNAEARDTDGSTAWNWVEITLWAIAAACQQGLSHTPDRLASRCIFLLGYITAYLLYTTFAAGITSLLVRPDAQLTVADVTGAHAASRVVTYQTSAHTILSSVDVRRVEYVRVEDFRAFFEQLEQPNTVGAAPQLLVDEYLHRHPELVQKTDSDVPQRYYMRTPLQSVRKFRRGFVVSVQSPWAKWLNQQLVRLSELGILQRLYRQSRQGMAIVDERPSAYSSVGQEHVGSAGLLFLTGLCTSVVLLAIELCVAGYVKLRNKRIRRQRRHSLVNSRK